MYRVSQKSSIKLKIEYLSHSNERTSIIKVYFSFQIKKLLYSYETKSKLLLFYLTEKCFT